MEDLLKKYNKEIRKFCKVNRISKLSLFGSHLKGSYTGESDIDILVEFEKGAKPGLLDISRMERELSEIVGKKIDLRTPEELGRYFKDTVLKEAQVKYESGR